MIPCTACSHPAAVLVSVLAPTGETIDSDTGTAPVLAPVLIGAVCGPCGAAKMDEATVAFITALGGHVDVEPCEVERVRPSSELARDAIDKAFLEAGITAALASFDSSAPIDRLEAFRKSHTIVPVEGSRAYGSVRVCATDGIRVHPRRGHGWYHDPGEVSDLTAKGYLVV